MHNFSDSKLPTCEVGVNRMCASPLNVIKVCLALHVALTQAQNRRRDIRRDDDSITVGKPFLAGSVISPTCSVPICIQSVSAITLLTLAPKSQSRFEK
jgi:hypothetical protein